MLRVVIATILSVMVALAVPGHAGDLSYKDMGDAEWDRAEEIAVTTAHGCYHHRGRRYCSRYCYVEHTGRRYCQERLREAHPQSDGSTEAEYLAPEVSYRRPRRD